MSVFNPTSVLNQFHANIASITTGSPGAFTRSAYRFELDKEPASAQDGLYFVDLNPVTPYERKWGTGEHIANGTVTVRVAYFRGGGDKGGGDRYSVRRHAGDDAQLIADVCENPDNYNSSASGIRTVTLNGWQRVATLPKTEIWETSFAVQWRSDLSTIPVQDLMVASMIVANTAALSALPVVSLAPGTGAVIPASSASDERLFFLDKTNARGSIVNGDTILAVTGSTAGVWREHGAPVPSATSRAVIRNAARVLFTGDSNTASLTWYRPGLSTTFDVASTELGIGFVKDVNTRLATPIVEINTGVNGSKVQDLIDNFTARIGSQTADLIIPFIGLNDSSAPTTVGIAAQCLAFGALLAALNKPVIWPSVLCVGSLWAEGDSGPEWNNGAYDASIEEVNTAIRAACDEFGFIYVDQRAAALATLALSNQPAPGSQVFLTYDTIHLRPLAAVMLGDLIRERCTVCP